jgi:hypothetical protein
VAYTEPPIPDLTPPAVASRSPASSAVNIAVTSTITARLSEAVTGVGSNTMVLSRTSDLVPIPTSVTYDPATLTATLQPSAPLQINTTYRVAMSGSIKDLHGNSLPWTWWTFTTPTYDPPAQVVFKVGTQTGYKFSSTGAVIAVKSYTLSTGSSAFTSTRAAIVNQSGTWFYVTNGVWAGYWIRQSSSFYLAASPVAANPAANSTFDPAVPLVFKKGTHTGYQFSSTGAMTAQNSYTLPNDQNANTSARQTITNQYGTWFYVVNGVWAGYWMRASDVLYLKP